MDLARLNLAKLRPWWLRLLLLIIIGFPMVTGWGLPSVRSSAIQDYSKLDLNPDLQALAAWTGYGLFIWIFVGMNIGMARLLQWLSAASVFGITLALTGGAFRRLDIWSWLERLLGQNTMTSPGQDPNVILTWKLLTILAVFPYALFFLNCFSVSELLKRVSRMSRGGQTLGVHLALFIRVFQHGLESVTKALVAWREENPEMILPRFRCEWSSSSVSRLKFFPWFKDAVFAWCFAILMKTLAVVPIFVGDVERMKLSTATDLKEKADVTAIAKMEP